MVTENQRLSHAVRDATPCKNCPERFIACHDRCPKDARGERGYKAWKSEVDHVKQERLKYLEIQREIMKHQEKG